MRDIEIKLDEKGYADYNERFIGNQYENKATRLVLDLPACYVGKDYFQYAVFTLPNNETIVRQIVKCKCIVDNDVTKLSGLVSLQIVIKSIEGVDDLSEGLVIYSQPISCYIKPANFNPANINDKSIDENVKLLLDEFDVLLAEIRTADDRFKAITDASGNMTEVVDARAGYTVLNNRLNAMMSSIKSNNMDITQLRDTLKSMASGSPLVAGSIIEMTDTSRVYVNINDGNWYYYNGVGWVNGGVYQSVGIDNKSIINKYIADNSINGRTTTFLNIASHNMFNGILHSGYMNTEGKIVSSNNYYYTDFIPIKYLDYIALFLRKISSSSNGTYYSTCEMRENIRFITWFDSDFNVIEGNGYSDANCENVEAVQALDENVAYCVITVENELNTDMNLKRIVLLKRDAPILSDEIIGYTSYKEKLNNEIYLNDTQMNTIKNLIDFKINKYFSTNNKNLLNYNNLKEGYIEYNDIFHTSNSYRTLPKLEIRNGQFITLRTKNTDDDFTTILDIRKVAFYDINDNMINFYDGVNYTAESVPVTNEDVAYCVISIKTEYANSESMLSITDIDDTGENVEFIPFSDKVTIPSIYDETIKYKILVNFGDSIANGDNGRSYGEQIASKSNMTYFNYAKGGATISTAREDNNIISQVETFLNDEIIPDFILMNGGTNDILYSSLGNISIFYSEDDTNIWDTSTTAGGLEKILYLLKSSCPNTKIIYVIPHKMNTRNYELQIQYFNLIKEICNKWSIPIVSVFEEGTLNSNIEAMRIYTDEGTHPTSDGYSKFYVPLIESKLKEI